MRKAAFKKILYFVLGLFVIFEITREIYVHLVYTPYRKATGDWEIDIEGDYTYGVNLPAWPEFTGNLYISKEYETEADGRMKDTVEMMIWPNLRGNPEIGISVSSSEPNESENSDIIETYFRVDEKMRLMDSDDPAIEKMYWEHLPEIEELFELAYQKWGILKSD